jgi:hypothetical protein
MHLHSAFYMPSLFTDIAVLLGMSVHIDKSIRCQKGKIFDRPIDIQRNVLIRMTVANVNKK